MVKASILSREEKLWLKVRNMIYLRYLFVEEDDRITMKIVTNDYLPYFTMIKGL
jgi:hypothetical protein